MVDNKTVNSKLRRIALITDGIWPYVIGGMQKHSFFLCKYLATRGVKVHLFHIKGSNQFDVGSLEFFTAEEKRNIISTVIHFPQHKGFPGHYLLNSYLYSKKVYNNLLPIIETLDFVYAQGLTSWYFIKKFKKKPLVGINIHGYEFLQSQANIKSKVDSLILGIPFKYINKKANVVFSLGGKLTNFITGLGVDPKKIVELPGGIEKDWVNLAVGSVGMPRTFVFVGRYERRKGIDELNQAIRVLVTKYDFNFHFVGPIPKQYQILNPRIKYWGLVVDKDIIQQILRASDFLVCPSYSEGLPTVILEAMASGCSIISTDVGAISEMVDSTNGWLIPPANIKALEYAIEEAINLKSDEVSKKRANSVTKILKKFLWEQIIDSTIREIEEKISCEKFI